MVHLVLAMIERLGSTILEKPGQIIAFVNSVLENYQHNHGKVQSTKQRNKRYVGLSDLENIVDTEEPDFQDEDDQEYENETLALSLTLLTSLLAGMLFLLLLHTIVERIR